MVEVGGTLAAIVIRKDETRAEAGILSPGSKILKLSTFKMALAFRGEKFGEQLLKQCLWFAQSNGYDVVYLTAYADKDVLLTDFDRIKGQFTRKEWKGRSCSIGADGPHL